MTPFTDGSTRYRTAIFFLTTKTFEFLWDVEQVDAKAKRIWEQYLCSLSLNGRVEEAELFAVITKVDEIYGFREICFRHVL